MTRVRTPVFRLTAPVVPPAWEPFILQRQAQLRRPSQSHYLACLVEDDLRAAGLIEPATDTSAAELLALAQQVGLDKSLAVLRSALRPAA